MTTLSAEDRVRLAKSTTEWVKAMRAVSSEAAGVMSVTVIRPVDALGLFRAARMGDAVAARLSRGLIDALNRIDAMPRSAPALCGCCPRRLVSGKFAVVLATPERDDPSRCLALAICRECGTTAEQVAAKSIVALKRLYPDARAISIHPEGGHA